LLADGDFMGAALSALGTLEKQKALSVALDGFSRSCSAIVKRHLGSLVYSGGDDVLALVPLHTALACARALHDAFAASLAPVLEGTGLPNRPTLSVGLAIAHHLTDMAEALELARAAERRAKRYAGPAGPKDALAILAEKRSGPSLAFVDSWKNAPDELLVRWAKRLDADELPRGLVHELGEVVAPLLVPAGGGTVPRPDPKLVASLLTRTLVRKHPANEAKKLAPELREELEKVAGGDQPARSLEEFSQMLQIAVLFLDAYRTAFRADAPTVPEGAE
jgi:CRISPR-associated protein Cmr2